MFIARYHALLIICCLSTFTHTTAHSTKDFVTVTLYYESLCPYCQQFVSEQLYPGYLKIKEALGVDLVPYGKANQTKVNNRWSFTCQHGPKECFGNEMQACVLAQDLRQEEKIGFIGCIMGSSNPASAKNGQKANVLKVSIYYETLCPDCIRFITKQFYPAFEELQNYLDVDLVPFGKAEASNSSGHWKFYCQHGSQECYGNKVHSCVLAFFSVPISIEFINCAMEFKTPDSNTSMTMCAKKTDVTWSFIKDCISSGKANKLLLENGKKTRAVTPPISFIPTIIFNDTYNEELQNEAQTHFFKVACDLLQNQPDICKYLDVRVQLVD